MSLKELEGGVMALGVNIHVTVVELCTQHRSATASDRKLSRNFKLQASRRSICNPMVDLFHRKIA